MRVLKILNNNALLAVDDNQVEYVFLGSGIGFNNKNGAEFISKEDTKKFILSSNIDRDKSSVEIVNSVEPHFIEISAEIITLAEEKFGEVDENILLPLADHIAFAIERIEKKMDISNPFTKELQLLFPDEFEVALKGKQIILDKTGIDINADEVSYITLHIHSAISTSHISLSLQMAKFIQDFIADLGQECGIKISDGTLSYSRFMTHMRYMIARVTRKERLDLNMNDYCKQNFKFSYDKAEYLTREIGKLLKLEIKDVEVGYLALHIERVIQAAINNEE